MGRLDYDMDCCGMYELIYNYDYVKFDEFFGKFGMCFFIKLCMLIFGCCYYYRLLFFFWWKLNLWFWKLLNLNILVMFGIFIESVFLYIKYFIIKIVGCNICLKKKIIVIFINDVKRGFVFIIWKCGWVGYFDIVLIFNGIIFFKLYGKLICYVIVFSYLLSLKV